MSFLHGRSAPASWRTALVAALLTASCAGRVEKTAIAETSGSETVSKPAVYSKVQLQTVGDMAVISEALRIYEERNGMRMPDDYDGVRAALVPALLNSAPDTDAWGTPYTFTTKAQGSHWRLISAGADRQIAKESLEKDGALLLRFPRTFDDQKDLVADDFYQHEELIPGLGNAGVIGTVKYPLLTLTRAVIDDGRYIHLIVFAAFSYNGREMTDPQGVTIKWLCDNKPLTDVVSGGDFSNKEVGNLNRGDVSGFTSVITVRRDSVQCAAPVPSLSVADERSPTASTVLANPLLYFKDYSPVKAAPTAAN